LWPNGWMHQDVTWYGGRPRPRRLCVRWWPSYRQKKRHTHPHPIFGPWLFGQTVGRIKMPLSTVVNVRSGGVVLDGVAAPPKRGTAPPPVFGSCLLWSNGWMNAWRRRLVRK